MVATGGHQLSLRAESVPLPWGPAPTRSDSVEVPYEASRTSVSRSSGWVEASDAEHEKRCGPRAHINDGCHGIAVLADTR